MVECAIRRGFKPLGIFLCIFLHRCKLLCCQGRPNKPLPMLLSIMSSDSETGDCFAFNGVAGRDAG